MFERFTERARQVVVLAQDEARALKHDNLDTEHILLGLLREEEGVANRALGSLGVTLDDVRTRVRARVGEGESPKQGEMPFTPQAKKVLELALREALSLGHNYIGTEHVLLGLVREDAGVAAEILRDSGRGADAQTIRIAVLDLLPASAAAARAPDPSRGPVVSRLRRRAPAAPEQPWWRPVLFVALGAAVALAGVVVGWLVAG